MALTEEAIREVLSTCYDPEIPVNIVDLGLVYKIEILDAAGEPEKKKVHVEMTLTAPGCPEGPAIKADVEAKLHSMEGVKEALVDLVMEPVWSPDKMTDAARLELGM